MIAKLPVKKKHYPTGTLGSNAAADARKLENGLTDERRAECLDGANALIYGRKPNKEAAGA